MKLQEVQLLKLMRLDIAVSLDYTSKEKLAELGSLMIRSFQMISKIIA